jgi:hypothetical protein
VVESRNRNHNPLLYHSRLPGRQSVIWQIVDGDKSDHHFLDGNSSS